MAAMDDRCTLERLLDEIRQRDERSTLERLLDEIRQRDERSSNLLPLLPLRPKSRGRPPAKGTVPLHVGLGIRALPWLSLNECDKSESSGNEQTLRNEREVAPRVVADAELECSGVVDNLSSEDIYDKYQQHHPCILAELLNEIHKKEASLKEKDEHIAHLKRQIQEYKIRCSNYEFQMKSMKKSYMKELTPLQSNIDAQIIEDKGSAETQLPVGTESTLPSAFDHMEVRKTNKPRITLLDLLKEFDQETEILDNHAELVSEVRQPDNMNFEEEFPKYKSSFWKNLKVRLRNVKKAFIEFSGSKKEARRRWTCAVSSR